MARRVFRVRHHFHLTAGVRWDVAFAALLAGGCGRAAVSWPWPDPLRTGCVVAVQLTGLVLLAAAPPPAPAGRSGAVSALASMLFCGLLLRGDAAGGGVVWDALLLAATCWTLLSLGALGRSFALLPAARQLVRRGPYRLVRHPVYAGECAMVACCVARSSLDGPVALVLAAAAAVAVGWRTLVEERELAGDPAWLEYRRTVRYRLVPGVF